MSQEQASKLDALFGTPAEPSKFATLLLESKPIEPIEGETAETESSSTKKLSKEEEEDRLKRTLFIGNLPMSATVNTIKKLFTPHSLVESIRFRTIQFKQNLHVSKRVAARMHAVDENGTQNAYVVLVKPELVDESIERLNGTQVLGNSIRCDHATAPGEKRKISKDENLRSVFVGQLPPDATEEELRGIFKDCGDIHHVTLIRDSKTGLSKNVAYVTFTEDYSVDTALKFNGAKLRKQKITVEKSNPAKAVQQAKKKADRLAGKLERKPKTHKKDKDEKKKSSFEGTHATKIDHKNTAIKKYLKMRKDMRKRKENKK